LNPLSLLLSLPLSLLSLLLFSPFYKDSKCESERKKEPPLSLPLLFSSLLFSASSPPPFLGRLGKGLAETESEKSTRLATPDRKKSGS
jgi:hypothetical protein